MTQQTGTAAGGGVEGGAALVELAERVLQVRGEAVRTVGRLPRVTNLYIGGDLFRRYAERMYADAAP